MIKFDIRMEKLWIGIILSMYIVHLKHLKERKFEFLT